MSASCQGLQHASVKKLHCSACDVLPFCGNTNHHRHGLQRQSCATTRAAALYGLLIGMHGSRGASLTCSCTSRRLKSMHGSYSDRLTCSCTGAPRAVALGITRGQPIRGEVDGAICLCSSVEVVGSNQLLVAQGGGEITCGVAVARPAGGWGGGSKVGLQGFKRSVGVWVGRRL